MTSLLDHENQDIDDGSVENQDTPIVNEALALVNDISTPLEERLPQIYKLGEQAYIAGGIERQHSGYIIECLYAIADEEELEIILHFNGNDD